MKGQGNRTNKPNGHRRSNSRYTGSNTYSEQYSISQDTGNDKLLSKITRSISKTCIASLSNGKKYQGLLTNADLSTSGSTPLSIVLMNAVLKDKNSKEKVPEKLVLQAKDLVDLEVAEIDSKKHSPQYSTGFRTDSDISGGGIPFKERELQRWVPEDDGLNPLLQLDDNNSSGHWDQFKVNEDKFGVESSYDEHLYTTRINTSAPDYEEKLRKAEKLAKEIENQASSNYHVLEERGIVVNDSGIDEEDKYSGVDRRGDELLAALRGSTISNDAPSTPSLNPGTGKYAPPRQRAAQYHNDPAIISSSAISKKPVANDTKPQKLSGSGTSTIVKPDSIPPKPVVQKRHTESFRLNAQSEINSLKEFSANFKIPHKIPSDLLPILAKESLKQNEILKKQTNDPKQVPESENLPEPSKNQKKKFDALKPSFKLNPKAAAFTPLNMQASPNPPKANFNKSPSSQPSQSPRMNTQRTSVGSNNSSIPASGKRHHQVSSSEFFGGASSVPTRKTQEEKKALFNSSFNMFMTAKKTLEKNKTTVVYEKSFQTPPTWDSSIDESHEKLFPSVQLPKAPGMRVASAQFIPSPIMGAPNIPGGYAGKFPISPQQQQATTAAMAAHFQQQQFQAAMIYQQQMAGGMIPGQPIPMYPGAETPFMSPNFIPPPASFASSTVSPVNGNLTLNNEPYLGNNYNSHSGNRRFNSSQNNHKKGSNL